MHGSRGKIDTARRLHGHTHLGIENADALVKAFTSIEQSGHLTEAQLADLVGEFTTLTDVLRDTSAAQAAVKSYGALAAEQENLGKAVEMAGLSSSPCVRWKPRCARSSPMPVKSRAWC